MAENQQIQQNQEITQVSRDTSNIAPTPDIAPPISDTFPPVRRRSQKQQEWSRQLGKRSQEFKRAKQQRMLQNTIPLKPLNTPATSHIASAPDTKDISHNSVEEEEFSHEDISHTKSDKSSTTLLFPGLIAAGIICGGLYYLKYKKQNNQDITDKTDNQDRPDKTVKHKTLIPVKQKTSTILSME